MNNLAIPSSTLAAAPVPSTSRGPDKVRDAARQFEALLMGQLLRSVRQSDGGWLGNGEDSSGECATDYAEQQFAAMLAQQGGLGMADLIAKGLTAAESKENTSTEGRAGL
jgi:Rod binding domain-containing protein